MTPADIEMNNQEYWKNHPMTLAEAKAAGIKLTGAPDPMTEDEMKARVWKMLGGKAQQFVPPKKLIKWVPSND